MSRIYLDILWNISIQYTLYSTLTYWGGIFCWEINIRDGFLCNAYLDPLGPLFRYCKYVFFVFFNSTVLFLTFILLVKLATCFWDILKLDWDYTITNGLKHEKVQMYEYCTYEYVWYMIKLCICVRDCLRQNMKKYFVKPDRKYMVLINIKFFQYCKQNENLIGVGISLVWDLISWYLKLGAAQLEFSSIRCWSLGSGVPNYEFPQWRFQCSIIMRIRNQDPKNVKCPYGSGSGS